MYLSISGHLGCFHILIVMNNSAVKIGVHIALRYSVFNSFGYILRHGIAGSYATCVLILRNLHALYLIYISSNRVQEFPFLHIFTKLTFESQCRLAPTDYWCVVWFLSHQRIPYNPHERTILLSSLLYFNSLGEGWHNK